MGLYVNTNNHPDVYKSKNKLIEPNQGYSRIDHYSEMIKEQQKLNKSLVNNLNMLKIQHNQEKNLQMSQWKEVFEHLNDLKARNDKHEDFEQMAKEWLTQLDRSNSKLEAMLTNESALNQEMLKELNILNNSHHDVLQKLGMYDTNNEEIHSKVNQIIEFQEQILEHVLNQDNKQGQVLEKLDNQEALMEKTLRQVNHLRSILYERASYLAEKIEEGYQLTSSFFYNLLTGDDQSHALFMINQKKEEENRKN